MGEEIESEGKQGLSQVIGPGISRARQSPPREDCEIFAHSSCFLSAEQTHHNLLGLGHCTKASGTRG